MYDDSKGWHFVGKGKVEGIEKRAKDERRLMAMAAVGLRGSGKAWMDPKSGKMFTGTDHQKIATENDLFKNGRVQDYVRITKTDRDIYLDKMGHDVGPKAMKSLREIAFKDQYSIIEDRGILGQRTLFDPQVDFAAEGVIPNLAPATGSLPAHWGQPKTGPVVWPSSPFGYDFAKKKPRLLDKIIDQIKKAPKIAREKLSNLQDLSAVELLKLQQKFPFIKDIDLNLMDDAAQVVRQLVENAPFAEGFVPNFSTAPRDGEFLPNFTSNSIKSVQGVPEVLASKVDEAVRAENAAGVPMHRIRIGTHPSVRSPGNLIVYDAQEGGPSGAVTAHKGAGQAMKDSSSTRAALLGAASGTVPNLASAGAGPLSMPDLQLSGAIRDDAGKFLSHADAMDKANAAINDSIKSYKRGGISVGELRNQMRLTSQSFRFTVDTVKRVERALESQVRAIDNEEKVRRKKLGFGRE